MRKVTITCDNPACRHGPECDPKEERSEQHRNFATVAVQDGHQAKRPTDWILIKHKNQSCEYEVCSLDCVKDLLDRFMARRDLHVIEVQ